MLAAQLAVCLSFVFHAPTDAASIDATAQQALAALPGKTAFAFTELTTDGPRMLFGVRPDERLAMGSSFKLYIFGTLADQVNAGRRRSDDTMLLRRDQIGPPTSEMADWPIGSPVTLYTLALKMMSISDNTATDHLIYLLGRERIERQMSIMGHGAPKLNTPLLTTREMTMLRDKSQGMPGKKYLTLDEGARRQFLARLDAGAADYDKLDFDTAAYDVAEWYGSPMDMARALSWIQRHTTDEQTAHLLLAILAVDPKLKLDPAVWPFVGFKGGSEDQLLAGNWLLKNHNGNWYTFHVFCNSPTEHVAPDEFVAAINKILSAIEPTLTAPAKP